MAFLSRAGAALAASLALTGESVNLAEAVDKPFQDEAVQLLQHHSEKVRRDDAAPEQSKDKGKHRHSLLRVEDDPLQALSQDIQQALKLLPQTTATEDLICQSKDADALDESGNDPKYAERAKEGQCDTPAGMWHDNCTYVQRFAKYTAIVKFLGLNSTHSLLDWGTGCGVELADVASKTGIHSVGIDLANGNIEWANTNLNVSNAKYCLADGTKLPFKDASADAIISNAALYHVNGLENEEKAIQEMLRVLRPGGCAWHAWLGSPDHDLVTQQAWDNATIPGAIHCTVREKDIFGETEYGMDTYSLVFCKQ